MSKTYTLTEVATALEADSKTLREWIKREGWNLTDKGEKPLNQTSKYDKRIFYLTEEQVQTLAKAHERQWPPRPKSAAQAEAQATGITGAVSLLREHVDALREDHIGTAQFSTTVKLLQDQIDELERKQAALLQQNTAILLQLAELQQTAPKKPGRKPKSATADTPEYQAGLAAVEGDD
jgi:hypothetical protein